MKSLLKVTSQIQKLTFNPFFKLSVVFQTINVGRSSSGNKSTTSQNASNTQPAKANNKINIEEESEGFYNFF